MPILPSLLQSHCQPTPPGGWASARNDAIRENTFALFVGMCIRTATFTVGKPGASKSLFLSLDLLTGMLLTREQPVLVTVSRRAQKVFQCDPLVTPESILHAAEQVERLQLKQQKLSFEEHVGVLVLEEVGVTVLSPAQPIEVSTFFLDCGVEVGWSFRSSLHHWHLKKRVDPANSN